MTVGGLTLPGHQGSLACIFACLSVAQCMMHPLPRAQDSWNKVQAIIYVTAAQMM